MSDKSGTDDPPGERETTMDACMADVNESTFEADVVERSHRTPVVVDFWAPWCDPCRTLGPLLERLAEEHGGAFFLAKVNVDENPYLAEAFGVSSIPAVKAVRDGAVVGEFVGAQPDRAVHEFLAGLLPSEADELAKDAERLEQAGKIEEAAVRYEAALKADGGPPLALLGLGRITAAKGDTDRALALLEQVPVTASEHAQARSLLARVRLQGRAGEAGDEAAWRARIAADPDNADA